MTDALEDFVDDFIAAADVYNGEVDISSGDIDELLQYYKPIIIDAAKKEMKKKEKLGEEVT